MQSLVRALSKMFLVLVLLFGGPSRAALRERERRPAIALVTSLRRGGAGEGAAAEVPWPEPWPPAPASAQGGRLAGGAERVYIPVRAA